MKTGIHLRGRLWRRWMTGVICVVAVCGCEPKADENAPSTTEVIRHQETLLSFAFDTATAIPMEPHKKDRARSQYEVVTACIEAGQPARAAEYARHIANWRQGVAFGDLAFHMAERGDSDLAESYLDRASRTAVHYKGWRKDRIKVRIAQAKVLLGQMERAEELTRDVEPSEQGKLAGVKPIRGDEDFEQRIEDANEVIASGDFDRMRNAVAAMGRLYASEYENVERRRRLGELIEGACGKMPVFLQIETVSDLAEAALRYGDKDAARSLAKRAHEIAESATWRRAAIGMEIKAGVAELRYQAGDEAEARKYVGALLEQYQQKRGRISSMDRSDALRPIAEAYKVMGDRAKATEIYQLAVKEGAVNPNARVRAIDLTSVCCSMAVHQVVPGEDLWAQMKEIRGGLSDPW